MEVTFKYPKYLQIDRGVVDMVVDHKNSNFQNFNRLRERLGRIAALSFRGKANQAQKITRLI